MGVNSRLLTLHSGGGGLVDTFDTLNPRWQVLNGGTIAVNAGALRAVTAGDWGNNGVTNGESWTGGPPPTGWVPGFGLLTQQDATALGIAPSGGADQKILRIVCDASGGDTYQNMSATPGAIYRLGARLYAPSANTGVNIAGVSLRFLPSFGVATSHLITVEDTWEYYSGNGAAVPAADTGVRVYEYCGGGAANDIGYFDQVVVYRQNTPCRLLDWDSPNGIFTLDMLVPAAGVVPFSWLTRIQDSLNYFEVRVTPNTAGNDLEIVQVTAGVATSRAAVDVDWTASATEQLEVSVRNTTIATRYKKTGGAWTAGASYASATQRQTSGIHGVMLWDTAVNRLDNLMVQP